MMVQLKGGVVGPFPVKQLRRLNGFTPQTFVSFPGSDKWAPAYRVLSLNSYEPPMAAGPSFYEPMLENTNSKPLVFDWKAKGSTLGWVDRWFQRLAIFNAVLAVAAYAAWSYPPVRAPLEKELRVQINDQWRHWRPIIATHWKLPIALPLVPFTSTKAIPLSTHLNRNRLPSHISYRTH